MFEPTRTLSLSTLRRILFTVAVLASASSQAADQHYSAAWAQSAGGPRVDGVVAADTDAAGNVYVLGRFIGTAHFGDHEITVSAGLIGLFVAKLSPHGDWLWAVTSGDALAMPGDIVVNDNGTVYVTGRFANRLHVGNSTLQTATGAIDPFVAALTTNGEWMWAVQGSGLANHRTNVHAIEVGSSGGALITGGFSLQLAFGSTTLLAASNVGEVFVASVDASGHWQWATAINTPGLYAEGRDLAVDAAGNVLVCGPVARIDVLPDGETIFDTILAKLDTAGNVLWTTYAHGIGINPPYPLGAMAFGIAVDQSGNTYVAGNMQQIVEFGPISVDAGSEVRRFIAKANLAGIWEWAIVGDVMYSDGAPIWTTDQQSVLVQTWVLGASLLGEFDSDGNLMHLHHFTADPQGRKVAVVNADRSVILAGAYDHPIDIGPFTFADPKETDAYVAKIVPRDLDQDLLSDYEESLLGTDPNAMDSDGDGVLDGIEVELGTDPNDQNGVPMGLPVGPVWVSALALLIVASLSRKRFGAVNATRTT